MKLDNFQKFIKDTIQDSNKYDHVSLHANEVESAEEIARRIFPTNKRRAKMKTRILIMLLLFSAACLAQGKITIGYVGNLEYQIGALVNYEITDVLGIYGTTKMQIYKSEITANNYSGGVSIVPFSNLKILYGMVYSEHLLELNEGMLYPELLFVIADKIIIGMDFDFVIPRGIVFGLAMNVNELF